MNYANKFSHIKHPIQNELDRLEENLKNSFQLNSPLIISLNDFLLNSAKRIRPMVSILFYKAMHNDVQLNDKQIEAISAIELIHNATLIHDDIIDNSDTRRNNVSINKRFDNSLAVIAGDYLLSIAMKKIIYTKSTELLNLCTASIEKLCIGEISQYFDKFKIPTMDEYIEKTKNKTAALFTLALQCLFLLDSSNEPAKKDLASDFGNTFGIAFQIRDDLINFKTKKTRLDNDINNGIYTAPIILSDLKEDEIAPNNIYDIVNKSKGLEKTTELIDTYIERTKNILSTFKKSMYKDSLLNLVDLLKEEN